MDQSKFDKHVSNLTTDVRINEAKTKTDRVVDHLRGLIDIHEGNRIIFWSDRLSSQIPTSFAANAFNVFQQSLYQFEIVRLCALWDSPDKEKENIATIVELIDHQDVIDLLAEDSYEFWSARQDESMADRDKKSVRDNLKKVIEGSREILESACLKSIMNVRDKHLAHSLSGTRREGKGSVEPMKYGDVNKVVEKTLPIVEALHCCVNGAGFSFKECQRIARKNAEALWSGCSFKIIS